MLQFRRSYGLKQSLPDYLQMEKRNIKLFYLMIILISVSLSCRSHNWKTKITFPSYYGRQVVSQLFTCGPSTTWSRFAASETRGSEAWRPCPLLCRDMAQSPSLRRPSCEPWLKLTFVSAVQVGAIVAELWNADL